MATTFGTNRFSFLEPSQLSKSCVEAESAGFDSLWFPDTQLHAGDVFINLLTALRSTERARAGTLVVNPVTRHSSVIASSIAAVDGHAPGRVMLGIASGDTSVWQVGLRPARLAELQQAVRTIRALLGGQSVDLGWTAPSRLDRPRQVPVIVACGGPKSLRMAGRCADGVVIRVGADPALVRWAYEEFRTGAVECGRDPATMFVALHFHTVIADDPNLARARGRVMAAGYYEVNPRLWQILELKWPCAPVHEILRTVRPDFHHAIDMDLAARMVVEIPDDISRRFCLMGNAAEVRRQLERLLVSAPWANHVVLQPNLPGPPFIAACGSEIIPAFR
jgi:5,10-methylenetetrahydromethanopterin reductase